MSTVAEQQANESKSMLGFWIYLMTDCVLFASLFATYAVLHTSTNGGQTGRELFDLPFVLLETVILLTSSFACGLGLIAAKANDKSRTLMWYGVTFLLGCAFLALELSEFRHLALEGNSWRQNAFLSSFFTLVGTHGLHITSGLIWMLVLLAKLPKQGLDKVSVKRLTLMSMFWHFLDVVWIFIFTVVYLLGALNV